MDLRNRNTRLVVFLVAAIILFVIIYLLVH